MAEPRQPQQPQIRPHGQHPLATAIQKLQDLFSKRGLLIAQVLAVVMLVPLGGVLLLLTGLTLAGTLIGLAVTAPLLVLFSPIIVPVALTIGLLVSGFLTSVAFGVTALYYFKWMEKYLRRIRMPSTPVPSPSSTSEIGNQYYVFLSFRGSDTRKGFVDHLYNRLKDVGLRLHPNFVFRDDDKLAYGDDIATNLISAIKHSKVSIPVISPTYASSQWCLRELIQIMECNERGEQTVLPVLFNVTPRDVRYLRGSFGDAFRRHEHYFNEEVKQQGREALKKATDTKVFESEIFANGYEAELVNKLVENVMRKQQEAFQPRLPEKLVGFDDHVAEVMKLADPDSTDIRIIGIYGIGGVGKTTLAKIIYKKLFDKFKCRSFLEDIRETIKRKGIEHVQSQLISNILKLHDYQVYNSNTAISVVNSSFNMKKVLILLDDVDNKDHLANLIGDCSFMPGSRIIVTCQDKATWDFKYAYPLKEMDSKDSLVLFSRYAFEEKPIPKELSTLSRNIVDTIGGLPLALEVIGLSLKTKEDKRDWEEMLQKLRSAPHKKVQEKLRISYDTLESKEQQMFLDIACFFIGTDKSMASYLWEGLDMYPRSALAKMIGCSLIKYDDNNELRMHNQLRNLGKDIARQEHKELWLRSRLWDEEAMTVLGRKVDNECIEALRLDEDGSREFMKQESFKRMPILKFLHGSAVVFAGDFERSLSELRWLKWERCPNSFEATKVDLKKLLILDLSGGYISRNWRGWSLMKMERLKVLNLSWCSELTSTPDLSAFENLERLILENCENLEKFHPSIRNVKRLISLNLRYCGSLKELPAELGELKELKEIVVDETDIQKIPPCIGSLQELTMLSAIGCHLLTQIPSSISHLVNLTTLNLNTCKTLQELPDSFQAGGKLQRLSLVRCYMLKQIPSSIGELGDLVELDLSSTRIKELPKSIEKLNNLKILRISNSAIEKIPSAIGKLKSLQELDASGCHKLKGQILTDKGGLSSLGTLRLGSAKISGLPENFHELSTLKHLDLLYCSELQSLPKPPSSLSSLQLTCRSPKLPLLSRLSHLDKLTLHSCKFLESIPELPSSLRQLRVCKCPELKTLPNLSNLKSLLELELLQCYRLMEFNGLEALESLRKLDLSTSTELSNLDDFEDLESLRYLDLQSYNGEADYLSEIRGLGKLKSLEVLNISARKCIKELDLSKSEHLKRLIVKNCESLVKICCHNKIEPLEQFDTDGCKSLTKLPDSLARDRSRFQREKIAKTN